jgi:hypothetical protein
LVEDTPLAGKTNENSEEAVAFRKTAGSLLEEWYADIRSNMIRRAYRATKLRNSRSRNLAAGETTAHSCSATAVTEQPHECGEEKSIEESTEERGSGDTFNVVNLTVPTATAPPVQPRPRSPLKLAGRRRYCW